MEYISAHAATASTTFQSENAVCLPGLFLSGLPKDLLKKTLVCSFFFLWTTTQLFLPWMVAAPSGNSRGFARNESQCAPQARSNYICHFRCLPVSCYHRTSHRYAFQLNWFATVDASLAKTAGSSGGPFVRMGSIDVYRFGLAGVPYVR